MTPRKKEGKKYARILGNRNFLGEIFIAPYFKEFVCNQSISKFSNSECPFSNNKNPIYFT